MPFYVLVRAHISRREHVRFGKCGSSQSDGAKRHPEVTVLITALSLQRIVGLRRFASPQASRA